MIADSAAALDLDALFAALEAQRRDRPGLRARDRAAALGVSEGRLTAARRACGEATALRPAPGDLLRAIAQLGEVLALTRSAGAVLENLGTYGAPDIGEHTGIVIGDNIDMRVFPSGWTYAYAVRDANADGDLRSVQIFDAAGVATHKVYLRAGSDAAAYERLVATLAQRDAAAPPATLPMPPATAATVAAPVPDDAFRAAYAAMTDTHDFFMLLRRFGLSREAGLRAAGPAFARPLAPQAHRRLFEVAARHAIPLMLFVSSDGMLHISSGPVPAPTFAGPWCNLIGARFNLHLDETAVARAWAVRKPTSSGIVTSLELYDAAGATIAQVFGERHEGEREREDWTSAIAGLPGFGAAG